MSIGRNEKCWCGSGKKYKRCHLNRESAPPLALGQLKHLLVEASDSHKVCLHPSAPTGCGRIIDAHTISRSGVLGKLVDPAKNEVLHFDHTTWVERDGRRIQNLEPIGWRRASVMSGFCSPHDDSLFKELEAAPFTGTHTQCIRAGYRAVCHELYQKFAALRMNEVHREYLDRGRPLSEQERLQAELGGFDHNCRLGIQDLERERQQFTAALQPGQEQGINALVISFSGDLCIAATGGTSPNTTFDGAPLQDLMDHSKPVDAVAATIHATDRGGALVLAWPKAFSAAKALAESITNQPVGQLGNAIAQFLFVNIENVYFSPSWWASLGPEAQREVENMAATVMRDDHRPKYRVDLPPLVPWTDFTIKRHY